MPVEKVTGTVSVKSEAFIEGAMIPVKYTCQGENINPPLLIEELPEGTRSLALILEDPDTAHGIFVHWVAWNIKPGYSILENQLAGTSGVNGSGKTGYIGPCPPSGLHRYYFKIFALDSLLSIPESTNRDQLLDAMTGHILSTGELMGRYKKS